MPASVVKSFAKKYRVSIKEVEKLWDTAKKQAVHIVGDEKQPEYWAVVAGLVKKRLKKSTSEMVDAILDGNIVSEVISVKTLGVDQLAGGKEVLQKYKCVKCKKEFFNSPICPYCGSKNIKEVR